MREAISTLLRLFLLRLLHFGFLGAFSLLRVLLLSLSIDCLVLIFGDKLPYNSFDRFETWIVACFGDMEPRIPDFQHTS